MDMMVFSHSQKRDGRAEAIGQPMRTQSTHVVSYREGTGLQGALLRRFSRCGQNTYFAAMSWVLFLQFAAIAAGSYALPAELAVATAGMMLAVCRLADAGYSRWLAAFAVPAVTATWIFPASLSSAPSTGLIAQFFLAFVGWNGAQFALALAFLAGPAVIGLAPQKRAE